MSVADLERTYRELEGRINILEGKVENLEDRVVEGGEHMAKIDLNYESMRVDINELRNDLKATYQESVNQIMTYFNENQKNEFELRKNQQTFIYKMIGTFIGSGGIVWVVVDFLIKK